MTNTMNETSVFLEISNTSVVLRFGKKKLLHNSWQEKSDYTVGE